MLPSSALACEKTTFSSDIIQSLSWLQIKWKLVKLLNGVYIVQYTHDQSLNLPTHGNKLGKPQLWDKYPKYAFFIDGFP